MKQMKIIVKAVVAILLSTQFANAQQCGANGTPPFTPFEVNGGVYHDIGVNAGGVLWVIGTSGVALISHGNLACQQGLPVGLAHPGGESTDQGSIAAGPDGSAYAVTNANHLWRLPPPSSNCAWGTWTEYPGLVKDVAVATDGTVWIIGTFATGGGFVIYRWTGSAWLSVPGGAVRIATAAGGLYDTAQPWVVNSSNSILHRLSDGTWQAFPPGKGFDIGIDASGLPWVVGTFHAQGSTAFIMYIYNVTQGWLSDPNIQFPYGGAKITAGVQPQFSGGCHLAYFLDDHGHAWGLRATGF
jgi:hypothetical protein